MYNNLKGLLKKEGLSVSDLEMILQTIEQIPSEQVADFYKFCVLDDVKFLAAFSQIKESDFDSWEIGDQWNIIKHLGYLIEDCAEDFSLIPPFLRKEPFILSAFVRVYFDRTDEEIALFKEIIKENGLDKNYEFIIEILKYGDGSVAGIIADESIKEMREYHIEDVKAYYNSPREYLLHDQAISAIPEKFMNDFSFILELIAINPEIILSLENHWKENEELCKIVLVKNGMLLEFLPKSVKKNPQLAAIALKQNPSATIYISDELTYDIEFIRAVVNENKEVLEYAIPRMKYLYYNE
jgi:hypothetical protein